MNSTELWQQIVAAPTDEPLREQFVLAIRLEKDWKVELFNRADDVNRISPSYIQYIGLKYQLDVLLEKWRVDFEAATSRWNAKIEFVKAWPEELTIAARDFVDHAPEIVATLPLLHLNLTAVSEAPEVFEIAQLSQIVTIDASHQRLSNQAITALAASNQLKALRWLDLSETGIKDEQVEILAAASGLKQLDHIDLQRNPCRDPVDSAAGCGIDGMSGLIVPESIWLPEFGRELEARYGRIEWLHALANSYIMYPTRFHVF